MNNKVLILVSTFRVDFYISGIAPLENQLVLLGCLKELDENGKSQRPTLHVIEPKYQVFSLVCANSLTLRGYKEYSCNDYHLDCLKEENRYLYLLILLIFISIKFILKLFLYLFIDFSL